MAELFVRHTLNSGKVAKFNLNLATYVLHGEEEQRQQWVLEIGTSAVDINGEEIKPVYIHNITEENLEREVEKAVASMCNKIDWSEFSIDKEAPYITYFYPKDIEVIPKTIVEFNIKEYMPSSGIDLSNMHIILNNGTIDFDITSDILISGDPYDYTIQWIPPNFKE